MTSEQKQRAILIEKQDFIKSCQDVAHFLENALSKSASLALFWEDNDYATEITEIDLGNFRFTKEELTDFVGMMRQLVLFADGEEIVPADYQKINNRIK